MVDLLGYFSFQPVPHDWSNKGVTPVVEHWLEQEVAQCSFKDVGLYS